MYNFSDVLWAWFIGFLVIILMLINPVIATIAMIIYVIILIIRNWNGV